MVEGLFEIRSRSDFSANDITIWVIDVFEEIYDITPSQEVKTEVYIRKENVRGRADVVVQDSIGIETKSNLSDEREKAEEQINNILSKLEDEGDTAPVGISTDGERWDFYILVQDEPYRFFDFTITSDSEDEEVAENIWRGLTALRRKSDRPAPTAEAVAEIFRPQGPAYNEITSQLRSNAMFSLKEHPVEFTSKFGPWFELFTFVYNNFEDKCRGLSSGGSERNEIVDILQEHEKFEEYSEETLDGGIELFLRHTYLALIAKVLSSLVTLGEEEAASLQLDDPASIVSGEAIREAGVKISDPNDFFTWVSEGQDLGKIIGSIMKPLQRFSDDYSDDVFRHLYENVVDEDTRHELGEFFTPKWMAQLMVNDNIAETTEEVLDPACGSGTFLVFSLTKKIELLREEDGEISSSQISNLIDEVWGIDVNPLSVILSRTNIYLALVSNVNSSKHPPEIAPRVYNADTFIFPRYSEQQRQLSEETGSSPSIIPVPVTPNIYIPVLPELHPDEAINYIDQIGGLMEKEKQQEDEEERLVVPEEIKEEGERGEYQSALLQTMGDLHDEYGNSLWKFVLRNYGIPPLMKNEFDTVIGNPPWLSYREARGNLKDVMDRITREFAITSPVQAKTSMNLSIPFFLTSANFVEPGGRISFVFPLSLLNSPAHVPFMDMITERKEYEVYNAYDLKDIVPYPFPHALPSAILTVGIKEVENESNST